MSDRSEQAREDAALHDAAIEALLDSLSDAYPRGEISATDEDAAWAARFVFSKVLLRLSALEAERDTLREAIKTALDELGIPGVGYPAPVANAFTILCDALASIGDGEGSS